MVHPVFPEQNPTMSLLNPVDTHGNMNWLLLSTLLSSFLVVFCPMFPPEKDHLTNYEKNIHVSITFLLLFLFSRVW